MNSKKYTIQLMTQEKTKIITLNRKQNLMLKYLLT